MGLLQSYIIKSETTAKLLKMQEAFFARSTIIMRPYGTVCILIPTYSSTACFALLSWRCTNENKLNTELNTEVILMLGVFMRKIAAIKIMIEFLGNVKLLLSLSNESLIRISVLHQLDF